MLKQARDFEDIFMYVIQTEKVQLVLKQVHFDSHQEM